MMSRISMACRLKASLRPRSAPVTDGASTVMIVIEKTGVKETVLRMKKGLKTSIIKNHGLLLLAAKDKSARPANTSFLAATCGCANLGAVAGIADDEAGGIYGGYPPMPLATKGCDWAGGNPPNPCIGCGCCD